MWVTEEDPQPVEPEPETEADPEPSEPETEPASDTETAAPDLELESKKRKASAMEATVSVTTTDRPTNRLIDRQTTQPTNRTIGRVISPTNTAQQTNH